MDTERRQFLHESGHNLLLLSSSLLVFGVSLYDYFFPEDIFRIEEGVNFYSRFSPENLLVYHRGSMFRPASWFYYYVMHSLFRMEPFGYRLVGIILQALCAFTLFVLLKEVSRSSDIVALLGTMFFTFNVIQRNIVFVISAHMYILVEICAFLGFLLFVKFCNSGSPKHSLLSLMIFSFGVFINANIITIVPAMIAYAISKDEVCDNHGGTLRKRTAGHQVLSGSRRVLLSAFYLLPIAALVLIEVRRSAFAGRYIVNIFQSAKNVVVFSSAWYFPFRPFGFTKGIGQNESVWGKTQFMTRFFIENPAAALMVMLALVTLTWSFRSLLAKTASARLGAVLFLAALGVYLPYRGISSRYLVFGVAGISAMMVGAMTVVRTPDGKGGWYRSRAATWTVAMSCMIIGHMWLLSWSHGDYAKMSGYSLAFARYFSSAGVSAEEIVICNVPAYSVEGTGLIELLPDAIRKWTRKMDLAVVVNPARCGRGERKPGTAYFIFEEPGSIRRLL